MTPAQLRQTLADQFTPLVSLVVKVGLPCALVIAGWVQVVVPAFQDGRENARLQTQILSRMESRVDDVDRRQAKAEEDHAAMLASVKKLLKEDTKPN